VCAHQAADSLGNLRLVREFGNEQFELDLYRAKVQQSYGLAVAVGRSNALLDGLVFFGAKI
jgi:hypothetical protein